MRNGVEVLGSHRRGVLEAHPAVLVVMLWRVVRPAEDSYLMTQARQAAAQFFNMVFDATVGCRQPALADHSHLNFAHRRIFQWVEGSIPVWARRGVPEGRRDGR